MPDDASDASNSSKPASPTQPAAQPAPPDDFVVEGMFPTKRVHLIAGPVGAGKSTYIYQLGRAILDGTEFMGKPTHNGGRFVYIAADRTRREALATLRRMGALDLIPRVRWLFINEIRQKGIVPFLETIIEQNCSVGDTIVVEPFQFFLRDDKNRTGDPNSYMDVSHWICKVKDVVEKFGVTLFGSVHPPKAKKGEGYGSVRDRLIGTSAWTGFTSTTVYIEPVNPDDVTDPYRTIHVLVRDGQNFTLEYMQEPNHGLLVPAMKVVRKSELDLWLEAMNEDVTITTQDAEAQAITFGKSAKTGQRWLAQKAEDGYVKKVGHGVYQKRRKS